MLKKGAVYLIPVMLCLNATGYAAPTQAPPDAGQTLQELERSTSVPKKSATTPSLIIDGAKKASADANVRFIVSRIQVTDSSRFSAAELEALVKDLVGTEHSLADLQQAAQRITAYYRERGYAVARAYLPAQEVRDGRVIIAVLEGKLGKNVLSNSSLVEDAKISGLIKAANPMETAIESAHTDRALLLLADTPGIGKVAGQLRPGDKVGTSDFIVSTESGKAYDGQVSVDNYGNRFTGQNRLSGLLNVNSPLGKGDQLSFQATTSNENLIYGRAAWDMPAGDAGLRLGAAITSSHYELGKDFENLDAHGAANTASLYGLYPIIRSLKQNVYAGANLEQRDLKDRIDSTDTDTDKTNQALVLNLFGDFSDTFKGGSINRWRIATTLGDLSIDDTASRAADQASARTQGSYDKCLVNINRNQSLVDKASLYASVTAQRARKNLDSSEEFVLGGVYGVRAYPQGEATGDEGWLATTELRYNFLPTLQGTLFYDTGGITVNRNTFAAGSNSRNIAGYGFGITTLWDDISVKADIAWRTDETPASDNDKQPRAWIQANWSF